MGFGPKDGGGRVLAHGCHMDEVMKNAVVDADGSDFELRAEVFAHSHAGDAEELGDLPLRDTITGHLPDEFLLLVGGDERGTTFRFRFAWRRGCGVLRDVFRFGVLHTKSASYDLDLGMRRARRRTHFHHQD